MSSLACVCLFTSDDVITTDNIVAKGAHHGPKALSVSHDGTRLAFIGPQEYIITIVDGLTLNEVLCTAILIVVIVRL